MNYGHISKGKLCFTNIYGLRSNFVQCESFLKSNSPDILALCETNLDGRLHAFSVTIPGCYKDVYVNSFFPHAARLWNSLPIECFTLTYDLSGFKSRINRHLLTVGSF